MHWSIALCASMAIACGSPTRPTSASFAGHWTGSYVVRGCQPTGWPSCDSVSQQTGSVHTFDLSLGQTGSGVTGTLHVTESPVLVMPVTGSVSDNTLSTEGTVVDPVLNRVSTDMIRLTRWVTIRDGARNMKGTFNVHRETLWGPASMGHRVGEIWMLDEDVELVNVVRQS
jgi:hypothetical protein